MRLCASHKGTHDAALHIVVLLLVIMSSAQVAHAQFSAPDIATTQFDQYGTPPSLFDLSLTHTAIPPILSSLTVGVDDQLTVQTDQKGRGRIDDVHNNGRYVVLRYVVRTARCQPVITLENDTSANTLDLNDAKTTTDGSGNSNQRSLSVQVPLGRNALMRLGYGRQEYANGGITNLYQNTFGIFEQTPNFEVQKQFNSGVLDLVSRIWGGMQAELQGVQESAPGRILLTQPGSPTSLAFPLSDRGDEYTLGFKAQLPDHSHAQFFRTQGSWAGADSVLREDNRIIGSQSDRRTQSETGIGWYGSEDRPVRYRLFYTSRRDSWTAQGTVPNGEDLGLPVPFAGNVQYNAGYDLLQKTLGMDYEHDLSNGFRVGALRLSHCTQTLTLGYRYITLRPDLNASYSLVALFFPLSGATSSGGTWLRAHELNVGYAIKTSAVVVQLGVDQLIPVASHSSHSGSSTSGGVSTTGTKSTDGGRNLWLTVIRPL